MKSPQSRINARRVTMERAADRAYDLVAGVMWAVALFALAVSIGAALAAFPQLDQVLDQAEQLRGF